MADTPLNFALGLIRSDELLRQLREDIDSGYSSLERARDSQYLRRSLVRAIFSFIEAGLEVIKIEVRASIRGGEHLAALSEKEAKLLGGTHLVPPPEGNFCPLEVNMKLTFKLASKVWGIDFKLQTAGAEFQAFLWAKQRRNRLTHPRRLADIEVSDEDMGRHTVAGMWFQAEFRRLFSTRVHSIAQGLPQLDREALLSDFNLRTRSWHEHAKGGA